MYKVRITYSDKIEIRDKSYVSYDEAVEWLNKSRHQIIDHISNLSNIENVCFDFEQNIEDDYRFELTYRYVDLTKYKDMSSEKTHVTGEIINKYTLFLENVLPKIVIMLVGWFFIIRWILAYI